jgi:tRNA pseudouridine13 synthase
MSAPSKVLPYATADLPGTGGVLRQTEDDFRVEEILAYEPEGQGDHVFVHIEKRGLTTPAAAEAMARALDVSARDVGWAGMKDKRAVTRQTLSFPPPCAPEAVAALDLAGITVLSAARHRHKLRTGHLRGNRFVLRVRDTEVEGEAAVERARAVLARLDVPPGSPNWFGEQRFGAAGDNADVGRALILGTPLPRGMRPPRGRQRRLYISALQSLLFNEYLQTRMEDGLLGRVLPGDLLQKVDTGGMFWSDDAAADQVRLDAGEVVPTGPMFGHKMMLPPEDSEAGRRERALLEAQGLSLEAFAGMGKLGTGTRRALALRLAGASASRLDERAIELCFELPKGSYATAVVREVVKTAAFIPGE